MDFYHYWQCEQIGVHRNNWVELADQIFQSTVTYSYRLKESYIPALLHAKNSLTMHYADDSTEDRLLGVGQATIYEGPNGEFNGIIDIANTSNSASMTRCFAATPDQVVISRHDFPSVEGTIVDNRFKTYRITETLDIKNTYYFHNSKDEVIGAMEDEEITAASAAAVKGKLDGLHPFPTVNGIKPDTRRTINKVYLYPTPRPLSFPVSVFEEPEPEPQYMMPDVWKESYGRHNYAGNGSRDYRVNLGDSYASIAEKEFGDASLGLAISRANGAQVLSPGLTIRLPSLISNHNKAGTVVPYQILLNIMEGNIMPFVRNNEPLHKEKHHGQFLKALISLLSVALALILALPTFGGSIGLGLGLKAATLLAGETVSAFTSTVITGVVAGLMEATIQGVLVGFGVKEFSAAEAISAGFAAMGSIWAGSAGSVASVSESSMSELLTETAVKAASINIAEQLALMAMNKVPYLDFKQVAASILGAAIDPQVSKLIPVKSPLAQMTMHTFSGTLVNTALYHKYDAEFLAAQLLSNVIVNTTSSAIMYGLTHINQDISHHEQKKARQAPRPLHAPEKRGYATKENVHQVAKPAKPAMKPDAFMRQMGIEDLLVDYQDALNDFYHEESYEPYIPSVDAGAFGARSYESYVAPVPKIEQSYWLAIKRGAASGVHNMYDLLSLDTVKAMGILALDLEATLIEREVAALDYLGLNVEPIQKGIARNAFFQASKERNQLRWQGLKKEALDFIGGSGSYRVEKSTEFLTETILSGGIAKGTSSTVKLAKMGIKGRVSEIGLFAKRPISLYHSVDHAEKAHSVLRGIDIDFLHTDNRFGQGFYLSEVPDTTLAELAHHGKVGKNTIRYHFDKSEARILDLTKPRIARRWKYYGGEDHDVPRSIAKQAKLEGYNTIRFNSERGSGANLVVLDDFNKILSHQMIVPAPTIRSGLSWEFPNLSPSYR